MSPAAPALGVPPAGPQAWGAGAAPRVVIDTNWVLDLCVFLDPRAAPLRSAIEQGQVHWLVCPAMVAEWQRVLAYPAVAQRRHRLPPGQPDPLDWFHTHAQAVASAPRCAWRCQDPDDQVFLDLAAQHRASLLSKDRAVLVWRRRAAALGLAISDHWPTPVAHQSY